MSRWNPNLDDAWAEDGDINFIGYNEKQHRSTLPPGFVAKSINKRFTDGTAAPRKGMTMPIGNRFWIGADQQFLGSFVYNNPNGDERLILCPSSINSGTVGVNSYDFTTNQYHTIDLPSGAVIGPNAQVWFSQGFDQLIMLAVGLSHGQQQNRWTNGLAWGGSDALPFAWFQWDGSTEFQVIPPSLYSWPVSDRIVYLNGYSWDGTQYTYNSALNNLAVSNVEDYQNYDFILGDFGINAGEADRIRAVIPYAYDTLVVFKHKSIHMFSNFSIDFDLATQQVLTAYLGISGVRAAVQVGSEIYFMTDELGIFKLSEVLEQRLMAPPVADSDPINPVIDRINWSAAQGIVAATLDHYLYFAVPLDGSLVNNAVIVKNTATGNYETIDMWAAIPGFRIDNLLAVHIGGVRRLVAVQNYPALVYLMYDGTTDQTQFDVINPRYAPIPDLIETRGYGMSQDSGPIGFKTFHRGGIAMETVNPNVKITAITEGENEEKILRSSITKDRTKYYIHADPDFPDDHNWDDPKREDYSLANSLLGQSFAAQDFSQVGTDPLGNITDGLIPPLSLGPPPPIFVDTEPPQASRPRFPIRVTDRWMSLRIENSQGTCRLLATSVESTESKRNARTAA